MDFTLYHSLHQGCRYRLLHVVMNEDAKTWPDQLGLLVRTAFDSWDTWDTCIHVAIILKHAAKPKLERAQ